jgi:glycine rich protein
VLRRRGLVAAVAVLGALVVAGCAATTDPPSDVTASSAVLQAKGRTDSTPAHYYFQYSVNPNALGTGFGQQTPTRGPIPAGVHGPNNGLVAFSEAVSGLKPNTTYYYRVCGGDGQTSGDVCAQIRSFTTLDGVVFDQPGAYSWTVPAGVSRAQFDVSGAQGQVSVSGTGLGAHVRAVLAVSAGETLTVMVGGRGGQGDRDTGAGGVGGFNGGAGGGASGANRGTPGGGGGGGASDVRTGAGGPSGLSTRLLVAGGGGGGEGVREGCGEGGSGGAVGQAGQDGCPDTDPPAKGGGGGTASAGGAGGLPSGGPVVGSSGGDGTLGSGGAGANGGGGTLGLGGSGGGGGYYGGGGGGSGFFAPPPANRGAGPGGGGGGSSFITPSALCAFPVGTGAQSGDGAVTITYNPAPC